MPYVLSGRMHAALCMINQQKQRQHAVYYYDWLHNQIQHLDLLQTCNTDCSLVLLCHQTSP